MLKNTPGLLFAGLMATLGLAQAAPTTYTLIPVVQGVDQLTGSLTVDDADGNLKITPTEITAWAFTAVGPVAFSISSAASNAATICSVAGGVPCMTVVGPALVFDFDSTSTSNGPSMSFSNGASQVQFQTRGTTIGACNPTDCGQIDWFTATKFAAQDSPTRAVAVTATAVPEPATLGLMLLGLGAGAGLARHRQARRDQPRER
jgi:hypothetical protein